MDAAVYTIELDGKGAYSLVTRTANGKSVFIQGGFKSREEAQQSIDERLKYLVGFNRFVRQV